MGRISFDHAYTDDHRHKLFKSLGQRGFSLMERSVEHPGRHFCQFIALKPTGSSSPQYLEFVHAKSRKNPLTRPGLSFGFDGPLETLHNQLQKEAQITSTFAHKNYNWKRDNSPDGPGWNFVNFQKLPFRSFTTWLTEYEADSSHPRPKVPVTKHKNGVTGIVAIELHLTPKARRHLTSWLGRKLQLSGGVQLVVKPAKINRFHQIILSAKSLKKFTQVADPDEIGKFNGVPAAIIQNPAGMWNLAIVDSQCTGL